MTNKPEISPCPFCGGEAKERWGGCAEFYGHEHQSVSIECDQCSVALMIDTSCDRDGLTTKGYEFACSCCNDLGAAARHRWNSRAADKARIAELESALSECAASLAWNCFGECRAVHDAPIMPAQMALEHALAALSQPKERNA